MQHLDLLLNLVTLFAGLITAVLGFLLYLKYKVKEIRYYAGFILTTTFTVTFTSVNSYFSNLAIIEPNTVGYFVAFITFEVLIFLINYSFSLFALGIIKRTFTWFNRMLLIIPVLTILLTAAVTVYRNWGKAVVSLPNSINYFFLVVLFSLFLSFLLYSGQIGLNLKNITNPDLQRALKVLALLIVVFIPIQTLIIKLNGQWLVIMLSRNIFYLAIDVISIVFAAKYFFIEAPSIIDPIEISESFIQKYGITAREKEVIGLLLTGLSIKEIGGKLDRSFKTVNNHIYNIYKKTNVTNKMELLNLVRENQL